MIPTCRLGEPTKHLTCRPEELLQKTLNKKESFVLTTPILEGPDGRKMSKSYGNAIWLDDDPNEMYAKIMAINDDLIIQYFSLATNLSLNEITEYEKRN